MIDTSWHLDDVPDAEPGSTNLHQLGTSLRRRRPLLVVLALLGAALGLAVSVLLPAQAHATVTMLLTHPSDADPDVAMATDISLLDTTTVSRTAVEKLGLDVAPSAFRKTFTASAATSQVLTLDVRAPDAAQATRRATVIAEQFLRFRTAQLTAQSDAEASGYRTRLATLQQQAKDLQAEYDALTTAGSTTQDEAADVLDRRAKIDAQIDTLQASIEQTTLQNSAVVTASKVVDPATPVPASAKKRYVLAGGSGLVGGLAVGLGLVLLGALTTRRLRSREDVARVLGTPVRTSVGPVRRTPRTLLRRRARRGALDDLVAGLDDAVSPSRRALNRIALASLDDVETARRVVARLGVERSARGDLVLLVDLTADGGLERAVEDELGRHSSSHPPAVHSATPLARGPLGELEEDLDPGHAAYRRAWYRADVVLTLAEIDPAAAVPHLGSWADRAVLLVTAGRSSEERLLACADAVRDSGVDLRHALLVDADRRDESTGLLR